MVKTSIYHHKIYFIADGVIPNCSKVTRVVFSFQWNLLCFTEEILIVCAEVDRETSDAADLHRRPHTDAHSGVWGCDFQPVCHKTQASPQVCENGYKWFIKVDLLRSLSFFWTVHHAASACHHFDILTCAIYFVIFQCFMVCPEFGTINAGNTVLSSVSLTSPNTSP